MRLKTLTFVAVGFAMLATAPAQARTVYRCIKNGQVSLANLPEQTYRLEFLVDAQNQDVIREMEISIKAGEIVGKLYDALLAQYRDPTNPDSLKSLNMLCVRLVFCLYAEDAGIFGKHGIFKDYLKRHPNPADVRKSLIELFAVLNQTTAERDQYMEPALAAFPYVNGGLFEAKAFHGIGGRAGALVGVDEAGAEIVFLAGGDQGVGAGGADDRGFGFFGHFAAGHGQ